MKQQIWCRMYLITCAAQPFHYNSQARPQWPHHEVWWRWDAWTGPWWLPPAGTWPGLPPMHCVLAPSQPVAARAGRTSTWHCTPHQTDQLLSASAHCGNKNMQRWSISLKVEVWWNRYHWHGLLWLMKSMLYHLWGSHFSLWLYCCDSYFIWLLCISLYFFDASCA